MEPEPAPSWPAAPTTDRDAAVKRAVDAAEERPVSLAPPTSEQPTAQKVRPSIARGEPLQVSRATPAARTREDVGPGAVIQRRPDVGEAETEAAGQPEAGEAETGAAARPSQRQPAEEPDVDELSTMVKRAAELIKRCKT